MSNQIFVPQTGTIYPSITKAAKALGVDPSNIGKVLRGARKSAGGFNFVRVDPATSAKTLQDISEALDTSLSKAQKSRQAKARRRNRGRISAAERAALQAHNQAARDLSGVLKEANKIMREYDKRGLSGISSVIPELEALKGIIGANKRGGFLTDPKELTRFSKDKLEQLKDRITQQLNRKNFRDINEAEQRKMGVAYQLGLSSEELDEYAELLPTLWNVLQLANQIEGAGSDPVYQEIIDAMSAGVDADELQLILSDIEAEQQNMIDENIDSSMYYDEAIDPYLDEIRDLRAHMGEIMDERNKSTSEQLSPEEAAEILEGWVSLF